jgi:hypothetical protein
VTRAGPPRQSRAPRRPWRDWLLLAGAYLAAGVALIAVGPFIGTSRIPGGVFVAALVAWILGLIILPAMTYTTARRFVLFSVGLVITFVLAAIVISNGLRSPFGY